jgi:hypothetical protein
MNEKTILEKALNDFANVYMNTGCDWDEAIEFAHVVLKNNCPSDASDETKAQALYFESLRYADM